MDSTNPYSTNQGKRQQQNVEGSLNNASSNLELKEDFSKINGRVNYQNNNSKNNSNRSKSFRDSTYPKGGKQSSAKNAIAFQRKKISRNFAENKSKSEIFINSEDTPSERTPSSASTNQPNLHDESLKRANKANWVISNGSKSNSINVEKENNTELSNNENKLVNNSKVANQPKLLSNKQKETKNKNVQSNANPLTNTSKKQINNRLRQPNSSRPTKQVYIPKTVTKQEEAAT